MLHPFLTKSTQMWDLFKDAAAELKKHVEAKQVTLDTMSRQFTNFRPWHNAIFQWDPMRSAS